MNDGGILSTRSDDVIDDHLLDWKFSKFSALQRFSWWNSLEAIETDKKLANNKWIKTQIFNFLFLSNDFKSN